MVANLKKPFDASCCDGGQGPMSDMSCMPCGCDKGANWVCKRHQEEARTVVSYSNPLEKHLDEVVDRTWNYAKRLESWQDHVLNAVAGLAGEAGEVLDEHKKLFFHTEKDRTENIVNEIGDLCYYLAKTLQLHGLTLEECLEANRKKLFKRHGIE